VAENAIVLLLPKVTNCRRCRRCRRSGVVVLIPHTFLVVYLYGSLESEWVALVWRRGHQQLIYSGKYKKHGITPHISTSHRELSPH
jgi:hypothetical protein